jgi:hypothetical protein
MLRRSCSALLVLFGSVVEAVAQQTPIPGTGVPAIGGRPGLAVFIGLMVVAGALFLRKRK